MIRKLFLFGLVLGVGMVLGALLMPRLFKPGGPASSSSAPGQRKILYYVDPMHPAYKSDKPGIAPDCGMKLEPVYEEGGPAASATPAKPPGQRKILYYVDPMHPAYKSDKPGIAPDCGMKLEPVYEDAGVAPGAAPALPPGQRKILYYVDPMNPSHKSDKPGLAPDGMKLEPVYADGGAAGAATMPPGTVRITSEKQQLIGVRFGEVKRVPLSRTVRAVGKVTYDETLLARVHTKFEGWIDQVKADFVGRYVKKGDPLLTIYSPDLFAAQQEFLLAAKARKYLAGSPIKEVSSGSDSIYEASRKKLQLWDITDEQIAEIERRNAPIKNMTVFAPQSGYILTRNAFPNQKIMPDTDLYTIAGLDTVWVIADVYEYEAPEVKVGQPVRMTLSYDTSQSFPGQVTYISPAVDNVTRTLKVRAEFANPGLRLKPDMFVNVEFANNLGRQLAVPEEAVMNSGLESIVFVDRGNGYLEPRKVELGQKFGPLYLVKSGLKAGEHVVTSGNFLVDSESRLKSAVEGMK